MPSLIPFHSLQVVLLLEVHSDWSNPPVKFRGGGGKPCGGPAVSLQCTVPLVNWVNRLLPTCMYGSSEPINLWALFFTLFLLHRISSFSSVSSFPCPVLSLCMHGLCQDHKLFSTILQYLWFCFSGFLFASFHQNLISFLQ
jgi:hypothetical protein